MTPGYQRPEIDMPEGWSVVSDTAQTRQQYESRFWHEFANEDLNRVVNAALAQNLDLQAALHRIEQARAQARIAGAALLPAIDASGGANQNYHDREALRLIITTDTTVLYTQILGFTERIRVAETNLRNAEEVLRIIEARYREGGVSALEVSQQKVAVNNIRAALTTLIEQRTTTLNALAILLGQAPQHFDGLESELSSLRAPAVNLTPPASLLTARPDIQSAEAGLLAANADIGAARAAFFPSLQLGTDTSLVATGFGHPATAALSLASNVLAPIFSGGRLEGNLENVTARQKELAAQYQQTVLTAFREVEDALAIRKSTDQQAALSRESVQEARNAYTIAKARFDAGSIDYLTLLETQRSLSEAEDEQIVATVAQLEAFVQLRKALGS
jgi:NodT family efflux transporter outer membrane factor (OMF) lipoprotein